MTALKSVVFKLDHKLSMSIERMVSRNEKAPLRRALAELRATHDLPIIQPSWFLAACYGAAADVSRLLVEADIHPGNDQALRLAASRGFWPVVFAQIPASDRLDDCEPSLGRNPHLLLMAAAQGQPEVLTRLLALPTREKWSNKTAGDLSIEKKATMVLRALADTERVHQGHEVVAALAAAGADLDGFDPQGYSDKRVPPLTLALSNGQIELARALLGQGIVLAAPGTRSPGDALGLWISGQLKRYDPKSRLSPKAWEALDWLAQTSLAMPEIKMDKATGRMYFGASGPEHCFHPEDAMRVRALSEQVNLENKTGPAPIVRRTGPRL